MCKTSKGLRIIAKALSFYSFLLQIGGIPA